jgi:hypothetical protein
MATETLSGAADMTDLIYADATILDGTPVDVQAQFAYGDHEPEAIFVFYAGTRNQVNLLDLDQGDWDSVNDAIADQLSA